MAELGKIEKPEAANFSAKRKLYVVPTLPFEELASQYDIGMKVERFWGEVKGKDKLFYFNLWEYQYALYRRDQRG